MSSKKLSSYINRIGIENIVWTTDLDGTLLDFQDDPESVTAGPELIQDLRNIHRLTGGNLFIVTGRNMAFVDQIFFPFQMNISAEHHCHVRGFGKNDVTRPDWSIIQADLAAVAKIDPAAWVEKTKPFSRTIHFRNVNEENKDEIKVCLTQLALDAVGVYNRQVGKEILGIKFGADAIEVGLKSKDKGIAIDDIMAIEGNTRKTPVFWGDSEADLPAALRVKFYGGIVVAVSPDEELKKIADLHFSTPEIARAELAEILAQYNDKNFIRDTVLAAALRNATPN